VRPGTPCPLSQDLCVSLFPWVCGRLCSHLIVSPCCQSSEGAWLSPQNCSAAPSPHPCPLGFSCHPPHPPHIPPHPHHSVTNGGAAQPISPFLLPATLVPRPPPQPPRSTGSSRGVVASP
jgi:hypothetical protein